MLHAPPAATPRTAPVQRVAAHRRLRRVLMVAPTSFFADYGCHVRILEEALALQRLGQRVTIVTYKNGRDMPGVDIRRTLPIPWRRQHEVGSSRHKIAFDALLSLTGLKAALATRPDVVHGHLHEGALIGGVLARLLGKPLVFDFQGSLTGEMVDHGFLRPDGPWHGPIRGLEGAINRLAGAIVTSSVQGAALLRDRFGVPAHRVTTVTDCVDTDRFRPDVMAEGDRMALKATLGIPPDRRVIAYLGLLAVYQGTDHLLEAARRVIAERPSSHFLIMGFPGTEIYRAKAVALGLEGHVTFTGRVPYEAAPGHLALGDVAVAPKMSVTEGSGKVLNYMAMGLPTVAFDTPVSRDYLAGYGLYAPSGDAAQLAARLLEALADPEGGRATGRRLRARAIDRYSWDQAAHRIVDIYDAVSPQTVAESAE